MRTLSAAFVGLLCLVAIAGCTTNKSIANIQTSQATLEVAVGTINDPNANFTAGGVTLNVVSSFRNSFGASAYEKPGTPALAGPAGAIALGSGTCNQLYSYGQFPTCNGVGGLAPSYNPPNTGPTGSYATGFIVTNAPTTSGNYMLSTTVTVNGGNVLYSASATLPASPTVLGNESTPTFVSDGAGGGTFTIGVPTGVTESLIVIFDTSFNELNTLETTCGVASVRTVATAHKGLRPSGIFTCTAVLPAGTLAAGSYNAIVLGADYPLVEAGPPANTLANPTLTGGGGTSDLTISAVGAIVE